MKRRVLVTLGLILIAGAAAQDTPSPDPSPPAERKTPPIPADWPRVEYAEVRAYLYNPGETPENLILQNGKLHPEVVNPDGIKLDATQTERLLTLLRNKAPDGSAVGCFAPHHGFVFYDREGNPVADVTVCFLCELGVAEPGDHSMTTWDFAALGRLVQDLGLPVFKDSIEADAHFLELAKHWPDVKIKAAIDKYLFDEAKLSVFNEHSLGMLLQGLGERTHPFLLRYLADENLRAGWLKKDPAKPALGTRLNRLCNIFGNTPPAAAIPLLAPFLDEADASARCNAAATISMTGAAEIVPFVRRALKDFERDISSSQILPPPEDLKDFADFGTTVSYRTLKGLQISMDRKALHPEAKTQLFPDVRALDPGIGYPQEWAKALISLDSNKALEVFLRDEFFTADSPKLSSILGAAVESNLQVPRERLLKLVAELKNAGLAREEKQWRLEPALVLLGQHHHPDDLALLREISDSDLAHCAMPGLLAWHGLHGYRDRLSKQVAEKGFDTLNEFQRRHFAAGEFELTGRGEYYFLYEESGRWRDALAGLKAMKRDQLATILEEAVAKFGSDGPSADLETRKAQFETLKEKDAFEGIAERMETAADRQDLSLDCFAIEHAESFK